MEKLELKHIVGYFPYGLKMISQNDFVSPLIRELRVDGFQFMIDTRKPILRPLSDLKKIASEIDLEFREDLNNDNYKYLGIVNYSHAFSLDGKQVGVLAMPYFFIEKLLENHFDIHGLIEKGLAIDINTIDNGIQ